MIQLLRGDPEAVARARLKVREMGSALGAYSGGVDSSLLLKLALEELPGRVVAVLASSPAYPAAEQAEARSLAQRLGAELVEVDTSEVELEAYVRNNPDRCFHCKEELFDTLEPVRERLALATPPYCASCHQRDGQRPRHGPPAERA